MIVDLILDRKEGHPYKAKEFYDNVMAYEEGTDYNISRALDSGTEKDVKKALCDYIMGSYNPKICNYINKVQWLEDDANDKISYFYNIPTITIVSSKKQEIVFNRIEVLRDSDPDLDADKTIRFYFDYIEKGEVKI